MNNKNLRPFKLFALKNFPFIEADFDAITNYELLCKIVEYLNNVIASQNETMENVQELSTAFNELYNYVNDYFDNLDVQEEINNKLDDMVEEGTLQEIIADYLNTKAVFGFDTVSDMKEATNLINGSYARTLGFNSKNDGGGALYKIRTITNEDIVNEMDIIAMSDESLIAELISDKYNAMCYGLTADDSNSNNHTILKYVIDKMKNIYIKENITLSSTFVIYGTNVSFTFNQITYTGNSYAISVEGYNIKINGQKITSNYDGIKVGGTYAVSLLNVNINEITAEHDSFNIGGSQGVQDSQFYINRLNYKNHGIYFDLSNKWVGQIAFHNTLFSDQSNVSENYAIYMDCSNNGMTGLDLYNISMEGAHGGIYVTTSSSSSSKFLEHLNVYGVRLAEFSILNNKKFLKLITPSTLNSIPIEGTINFDTAYVTSFDVSEFYSTQHLLELNGVIRTSTLSELFNKSIISTKGKIGYRKVIINGVVSNYNAISISNDITVIAPRGNYQVINGADHTVGMKFNTDEFMLVGEYRIYASSGCTLNILNNDGTTAKSYSLTTANAILLKITETDSSANAQYSGILINSAGAGQINN